jgi:glycerol-3-phosphate dehydrogenase
VASSTRNLKLIGSHYTSGLERQLADSHPKPLVDHLIFNYGGLAEQILKGNTELLDGDTLVTKAEIDFIVQNEMPNSIDDVVLRRTRVCFLDNSKAEPLVEYVAEALARAHGWTATRKQE